MSLNLQKVADKLNAAVTTQFEVLSPEVMAELNDRTQEAIAAGNVKQRPSNPSIIHRYTRDILNGDWLENPQTITITKEDYVIDGLHRIIAGIRSGQPVLFNVCRGWDSKDTFKVMDTGRPRTTNLLLQLDGMTSAFRKAGVARSLVFISCGQGEESRSLSPQEIMRVIDIFKDGFVTVFDMINSTGSQHTKITAEYIAAMVFVYDAIPDVCFEFMDCLFGLKFTEGHPARALKKWIESFPGRGRRMVQARATLNALHALAEKREVQRLNDKQEGLIWARKLQAKKVEQVRAIIGLK